MPFLSRALFKTVLILQKLNIKIEKENYDSLHILFHMKEYLSIYKSLNCKIKYLEFYSCKCCNSRINFLRNYSLYLHKKLNCTLENEQGLDDLMFDIEDEFIFYLKALLSTEKSKKEKYLLMAVEKNKLFYDALLELMPILSDEDELIKIYCVVNENEQFLWEFFKIEFYIYWTRDIGIENNRIIKVNECQNENYFDIFCILNQIKESDVHRQIYFFQDFRADEDSRNYKKNKLTGSNNSNEFSKETSFPIPFIKKSNDSNILSNSNDLNPFVNNLLAAYLYCIKKYDLSISYYMKAKVIDYLDFLSHILYIKNDLKSLANLSKFLFLENSISSEYLVTLGNFHSLKKEREIAINAFKKALQYRNEMKYLNNLIGHEYLEFNSDENFKNIDIAISYFKKCSDFRSFFGQAQCYLKKSQYLTAIEFFKRSLHLNDKNLICWHFLGDTYKIMNFFNRAVECFLKINELGNCEGLLLAGETYKEIKNMEKCVFYFKKYLEKKNDESIKAFLHEYDLSCSKEKKI